MILSFILVEGSRLVQEVNTSLAGMVTGFHAYVILWRSKWCAILWRSKWLTIVAGSAIVTTIYSERRKYDEIIWYSI